MNRKPDVYFTQCRRYGTVIEFKVVEIDECFLNVYIGDGFTREWFVFCGTRNSDGDFFGGHPLWF